MVSTFRAIMNIFDYWIDIMPLWLQIIVGLILLSTIVLCVVGLKLLWRLYKDEDWWVR